MGTVKVTNIEPIADNGTVTLGGSGDNLVIGSGAVPKFNYPAFFAYLPSSQTVSNSVNTKVQLSTEVFDEGGYFDSSTNYRFTPLVAGKYLFYYSVAAESVSTNNMTTGMSLLYLNGAEHSNPNFQIVSGNVQRVAATGLTVVDMNGTTDYVELFGRVSASSGTRELNAGSKQTYMGAFRIGD